MPEYIEVLDAAGQITRTLRVITNQIRSVEQVLDVNTGEVVQRVRHDVFGQRVEDTNPGLHPFGFGAGLYDDESDLLLFGVRSYSPGVGRWTNRDPIGFESGEMGLYLYSLNDVVNRIDPTGTSSMLPCSLAFGSASGIVCWAVCTGATSGGGALVCGLVCGAFFTILDDALGGVCTDNRKKRDDSKSSKSDGGEGCDK